MAGTEPMASPVVARSLRPAVEAKCDVDGINRQLQFLMDSKANDPISPFNMDDYVQRVSTNTSFLRQLISTLTEDDSYEMSDWEDEEAMKPDPEETGEGEVNGKKIPSWAQDNNLRVIVSRQNISDGDKIFQDMPRRVSLVDIFETRNFPYYTSKLRH